MLLCLLCITHIAHWYSFVLSRCVFFVHCCAPKWVSMVESGSFFLFFVLDRLYRRYCGVCEKEILKWPQFANMLKSKQKLKWNRVGCMLNIFFYYYQCFFFIPKKSTNEWTKEKVFIWMVTAKWFNNDAECMYQNTPCTFKHAYIQFF